MDENIENIIAVLILLGIIAAPVIAGLYVRYTNVVHSRTLKAQDLYAQLQNVRTMRGGQFEVFVAQVLRELGYRTAVLGGSGDQGVDIIATDATGRVAVQCKNYNRAVGNRPVQEVYAGARHHRCGRAWVVAPAGYTKGAHALAQSVGVSLFDADSIRKWIKMIDDAKKETVRLEARVQDRERAPWWRRWFGGGE